MVSLSGTSINDTANEINERYGSIFNHMLEGIQIIDFNHRYLYVNDAAVKQNKYSREELLGHTQMEKYPGIEKTEVFAKIRQCAQERTPTYIENEFEFPDGSKGCYEVRSEPIPYGVIILSLDITDRKQLQEAENKLQIVNALKEANKELEAFSYSVSHDLRAPLRAIDGFSKILSEDYTEKLDDEGKHVIATIRSSTQQMGQLIDDLLSFSRLGRQAIKTQDVAMTTLAKTVFDELKLASPQRSVQFTYPELPIAHVDPSLIRQVWANLLSNALKYTKKKEVAVITIGSNVTDEDNIYYVKDNGAGFDMKYVDKLFGVFQRLHSAQDFEGTGIGLSIVERIIKKHGGKVWAEGVVDQGATFYFSLPKISS